MNNVLIRNGRGRVRCYWNRIEPEECSIDGWAMFWEYLIDEYLIDENGEVALCYNHSDEPRKAYILELKKRGKRDYR